MSSQTDVAAVPVGGYDIGLTPETDGRGCQSLPAME